MWRISTEKFTIQTFSTQPLRGKKQAWVFSVTWEFPEPTANGAWESIWLDFNQGIICVSWHVSYREPVWITSIQMLCMVSKSIVTYCTWKVIFTFSFKGIQNQIWALTYHTFFFFFLCMRPELQVEWNCGLGQKVLLWLSPSGVFSSRISKASASGSWLEKNGSKFSRMTCLPRYGQRPSLPMFQVV